MAGMTTMIPFTLEEKFGLLYQIVDKIDMMQERSEIPNYYAGLSKLDRDLRILTQDTVIKPWGRGWQGKLTFRSTDIKKNYYQLMKIFATYDGTKTSFQKKPIDFLNINVRGRSTYELEKAMKAIEVDVLFMDLPDPFPNTTPVDLRNFTKLPIELRVMIWKFACHNPRLLLVDFNGFDCLPLHPLFARRTLANVRPSAILHVNQESRKVAKTIYEEIITHPGCSYKPFYLNPRLDTIYFSGACCNTQFFNGWNIVIQGPTRDLRDIDYVRSEFFERLQYVALTRYHWAALDLPIAALPNVKEVSLVCGRPWDNPRQAFNTKPGERPIPPEFLIADLREVSDSWMNEKEMALKTKILDYVRDFRSQSYVSPWAHADMPPFPTEDRLKIKFVTVVDEEGNEPEWVTNEEED